MQKQPPERFFKKSVLRNFPKLTAKKPVPESLVQVFSCEFREISKNTFFTKDLWLTASDFIHLKGATKSYFTRYSCVVIILFNTGLSRFAFSTISFRKLVFRLSVLFLFLF